jgi:hypothetical protein
VGKIAEMILSGSGLTLDYAERLLVGVTPEMFGKFARPGGVVLKSNHAAFVFGHLSLYSPKVLEHLKRPTAAVACPPGFDAVFKNGVECQDDPTGTIYPPMAAITDQFFRGYRAARAALAETDDALLLSPNPTEGRMRELFPTLGSMLIFYFDGHAQMHLGQVSAWRRAMGLAAA